jgi:hypothetical protein
MKDPEWANHPGREGKTKNGGSLLKIPPPLFVKVTNANSSFLLGYYWYHLGNLLLRGEKGCSNSLQVVFVTKYVKTTLHIYAK